MSFCIFSISLRRARRTLVWGTRLPCLTSRVCAAGKQLSHIRNGVDHSCSGACFLLSWGSSHSPRFWEVWFALLSMSNSCLPTVLFCIYWCQHTIFLPLWFVNVLTDFYLSNQSLKSPEENTHGYCVLFLHCWVWYYILRRVLYLQLWKIPAGRLLVTFSSRFRHTIVLGYREEFWESLQECGVFFLKYVIELPADPCISDYLPHVFNQQRPKLTAYSTIQHVWNAKILLHCSLQRLLDYGVFSILLS